jgi:DNA-binding transcriptional MerR regulator
MAAGEKAKNYKIGEVCKVADVQPYVLRYWETEFAPLAPTKSGGGQRVYTQQEVDIVLRIKELLYKEGFTIAGAKKKLEVEMNQPPAAAAAERAVTEAPAASEASDASPLMRRAIEDVKSDLRDILKMLQ